MQHRIVSLIPSATEIVGALGYQRCLVGRSHECDYPDSVRRLPVCCEPAIDVKASSREIDSQVKRRLSAALSVYRVLSEQIETLQPTHILTQTQCDVCAVSLADLERALADSITSRPQLVSLQPTELNEIFGDFRRVAEALDDAAAGEQLVRQVRNRFAEISAAAPPAASRPTVACIEWIEPLMTAGNWIPQLVTIAGGTAVLSEPGEHSPWVGWDALLAADPDVLVVMPCGFDLPRTRREIDLLAQHPGWTRLRAVQAGRVYLADGHQFFNRPGPRIAESAEILAGILADDPSQPAAARPGWQRLLEPSRAS